MRRLPLLCLLLALALVPARGVGRALSRPLAAPPGQAVPPESLPVRGAIGACPAATHGAGSWVFLSDLTWSDAQTGWPAVADVVVPERDVSFSRNPLVLAGRPFQKGLGTYPFSEVAYTLDGAYTALQGDLGLNDDSPPGAAAVFLVYADGLPIYSSGLVRAGEPPRAVELCLAGVRHLRLVTATGHDPLRDGPPPGPAAYAVWAGARLFRPAAPDPATAGAIREVLDREAGARRTQVAGQLGVYRQLGAATRTAVAQALGQAESPAAGWPAAARFGRDAGGRLILAHRRLALVLGFGGEEHGTLTAVEPERGTLLLHQAGSAVASTAHPVPSRAKGASDWGGAPAGGVVDLHRDTEPAGQESFSSARVDDPVLGSGTEVRATFRPRPAAGAGDATVEVRLTLFDDRPAFTYRLALHGWPVTQGQGRPPGRLEYLGATGAAFVLGDEAGYFADGSYVRQAALADDGLWRTARLGLGKPAAVWGEAVPGASGASGGPGGPGSLVLTLLDEQRLPAWLIARRDPASAAATVGLSQPLPEGGPPSGDGEYLGPRLLVELAPTADLRTALARYREVSAALFPPAPLPDWVRYQWGSWWVYGSAVDEARLRRQIDVIATQLRDLGPWHILIDAGWQDVGPDAGGDLGQEQRQRFPGGLRALVDYAHARGIRVILFFSAVYAHEEPDRAEWLALPGLIRRQPDWFLPLTPGGARPVRYLVDYAHPGARDYLAGVLTRYVRDFGADGVKLDGLGDVEGQLIPFSERATHLPQRWRLAPVMEIYRLVAQTLWSVKPDAFIESGWVNPATAHPYAHTFRYGDEWDTFDREYSFPGLAQHFTYAAVQRTVLGQRPHVGAVFGGFNRPIADQWLGAALALGAQVSLGSDLTFLSSEGLAALRAMLVHYRPFAGVTRTGGAAPGLLPEWASTTVGDLTFLAVLNRTAAPTTSTVRLAAAGLSEAHDGAVAFDAAAARSSRVGDLLAVEVPARSLRLITLRQTPGVVWTTSSYEVQPHPTGWRLLLRGPQDVPGRLHFHLPGGAPRAVILDGQPLPAAPAPGSPAPAGYAYDAPSGVLTVHYPHAGLPPATSPHDPGLARAIDILAP